MNAFNAGHYVARMQKQSEKRQRVVLSWSCGKDSAWTLHRLQQQGKYDVIGLMTTFNEAFDRSAMHGIRRELVQAQAPGDRVAFAGGAYAMAL